MKINKKWILLHIGRHTRVNAFSGTKVRFLQKLIFFLLSDAIVCFTFFVSYTFYTNILTREYRAVALLSAGEYGFSF